MATYAGVSQVDAQFSWEENAWDAGWDGREEDDSDRYVNGEIDLSDDGDGG